MKTNQYIFEKEQLRDIVLSCRQLTSMIVDSGTAANMKYKEMDKFVNSMISYECFFAYMYSEVYGYGQITDIMDTNSKDYAKYIIAASLVFTERKAVETFLKRMPYSWNKSKNFMLKMSYHNRAYEDIVNSIRTLTEAIAQLSQRVKS